MISVAYAQAMANYNREMNLRLYECCGKLADEQRKRNVGAFFKSLHGTLNHLLLGDRVWMGRFTDQPIKINSLAQELYADFDELSRERVLTDQAIATWASNLSAATLASQLTYIAVIGSQHRSFPYWYAITHFFNHQTHHRGQVTALLSQQGIDPGVTDLIAFPINV